MSATERARLARAAKAVLGPEADRGTARAGRLRRHGARASVDFADLDAVPSWLPEAPQARQRFIGRLGMAAAAPQLLAVIDGALLRKLADQVGPDLVDWGMSLPEADEQSEPLDQVPDVQALGHAVVRQTLPAALSAWFPTEGSVDQASAQRAIGLARGAAA